ncbi:MAG: glutathione-disulfide reductase [Myxococcota bacterium]
MGDAYDLVVIGGGSGGVRAARVSAQLGARVALVEGARMGGTCVNVGCVPKKLLSYGARFGEALDDMRGYGWSTTGRRFDWSALIAAKDREIERLNGVYRGLLDRAGVTVVEGWARVTGPETVSVALAGGGERELRGERLLVAVGGKPWRPSADEVPGIEQTWVSDDLFALPELPPRVLIVGAGYIGCEFATIFRGLGVQVTLAHRSDLPLRGFDEEVRRFLAQQMAASGIECITGCMPTYIDRDHNGLRVRWSDGGTSHADGILMATGRIPNTAGLGLEDVGVALGPEGSVPVDERFCTTVPSIFAVGDVIDRVQLTPVALAEATAFAHQQFADDRALSYENVPSAVFTSPQLGTVGLCEAKARAKYGDIDVYASTFRSLVHTLTGRDRKSMLKLLVDRASDRLVGVHIVDPDAAEIAQGFAAAMQAGITKRQLDATIGIHPTVAEELVTMRTPRTDSAVP